MIHKTNKFLLLLSLLFLFSSILQAGGKKTVKAPGEKKYPDLTKGEVWTKPETGDNGVPGLYNLGPTGLIGWMVGDENGCQIEVQKIDKGSPAEGKFIKGDLIVGVNGKKFVIGENMVDKLGGIFNEAETDESTNKIKFMVFRDKNWAKRNAGVDMANTDVDTLFDQVENDVEGEVYNWMNKDQKKASENKFISEMKGEVDGSYMDITVAVPVLGAFSETSPYDCPKTELIIKRGLKHIRKAVKNGRGGGFSRYYMRGHALLASGTKEDLEILHAAVRKNGAFKPDRFISSWGWGFGSWYGGYQMVFAAEYYLKTGDKYVLPALTEIATKVAMGQTYGGSWGHSLSGRSFNMGKINMRSSGYGAMNNAGGPCFYGLVMAKKCGISNIHTEAAIARSMRFYGAISELGATPYGMHPVAGYEDSNGKNGPPAFAFKMLGHKTHAQYFAWCQSTAANWKHGGHNGGEWGSMWRTFGAVLGGPISVKAYLKNRRNYYTMSRRFDGSWSFHLSAGLYGKFSSRTALFVLRYIGHKNTTYLTGKEPMKEIQLTEESMQDVYDANSPNASRAAIVAKLSDDQLIKKFSTFSIKMRRAYAVDVGKRYKAGNKSILNKVLQLLSDSEPRKRAGAVLAVAQCGEAATEKNLKAVLALFDDPRQFVRIHALEALNKHFESLQDLIVEPMMKLVTRKEYWDMLNDNNNVPTHVFNNLFKGRDKHTPKDARLCTLGEDPFNYGTDLKLTRETMERAFQWDPGRAKTFAKARKWDRNQVVDMIGPIVFGAEFLQHNDMMFAGGGLNGGRDILSKHNLKRELIDAAAFHLYLLDPLPRTYYAKANGHVRAMGGRTPYGPAILLEAKGEAKHLLPFLRRYIVREPLKTIVLKVKEKEVFYRLYDLILAIENDSETAVPESIAAEVNEIFKGTVSQLSGKEAVLKHCRNWLNPTRKTYFRQMAAMNELVKQLGAQAIADLIPYITHEQWRWRKHSQMLIKKMGPEATEVLNELYSKTKDDKLASGLVICMLARADKNSTKTVLDAYKNGGDKVKAQAVQALVKLTGLKHLGMITNDMRTIPSDVVLDGYEKALLLCKGNKAQENLISKNMIGIIKKSKRVARASIYNIMAMIGGETNLSILRKVCKTKSEIDFKNVVTSVSYSRDPKATQWMADLITSLDGEKRANIAAKIGARRMTLSANEEIAHVDDEAAFQFAKQVLEVVCEPSILRLLGRVCLPKSGELLFDYMKKGPEVVTIAASDGLIDMGGYMRVDAPEDDRKRVSELLGQVVEYITVTQLRVPEENRDTAYYAAKKKCISAGKNMLRIYDPSDAEVEDIDDDDIDI